MKPMTGPEAHHGSYDHATGSIYDSNINQWVPANEFYAHYGIETYNDKDTHMPRRTQALIVAGVLALLLLAIGITTLVMGSSDDPSPYTSSEQEYLDDVKGAGIEWKRAGDEDQNLLDAGYSVCPLLDEYTMESVIDESYSASEDGQADEGMTYTQATAFVHAASEHLCG